MIKYPNDYDTERLVLGTIIANKYGYEEVRDIVNEDCFYNPFHRNVFCVFKEIEKNGVEPDAISIVAGYRKLFNELKAVEVASLEQCSEVSHVYAHTCRLNDLSARRKLIMLGDYLRQKSRIEQEEITDIASHANDCLSKLFITDENTVSTISEAIKGVYSIIDNNKNCGNSLTGSPTGFSLFDKRSGGLQKSDLIVIAGETSQGKTSFALSVLNNTVKYGTKVAVYSLEMKKEQLAARLMAINSGIPANQILFTPLADYQFERLDKSINGLYNSCILFDDRSSSNIDTIIASIRSMVVKYKIDGAIVDYLQILNVNMKGYNKEQQMADVARRLKNLAKELDIWIIVLSQLNRDHSNPQPTLNRLRDSGQIAEAADIVMFVYRPEYYKRTFPDPFADYDTKDMALIDVAKGRNIGLLQMLVSFDKPTTFFYDINNPIVLPFTSSDDNPY